jgi:hypothetical protein
MVAGLRQPMRNLREAWLSPNFDRLRAAHRARTWDASGAGGEPICASCAVTKRPVRLDVTEPVRGRVPLRVIQ